MYVVRRLALGFVQLAVLAVLVFALTGLLPGDAADVRFAEHASAAEVSALRARLGLDAPPVERFAAWLGGVVRGDLGTSLVSGRPVTSVIGTSVGMTALLTLSTLLVVIPLAVTLGGVAGARAGGRWDRLITVVTVGLSAIPDFVLAVVLIAVFSLWLDWLPATWMSASPAVLVLPVLVLLGRSVCLLSRQVRAGMVATASADYVVQARRFGVRPVPLLLRHILPNAAVPAVQELARTGDALLGGVLVVEALFAIPGLATELVAAVRSRDVPVVQGITLFLAVAALLINLVADLVCDRLVPRRQVAR
ncbi:ABC transporter permease [Lentzea tibetensis]|uniref:ABC transporter permease n=1 Tax=Lentzea tibetensis TaxID=2591470 RepID=A0A563F324_9PSEU|nr:ABC transporter permease [Lentzea tibetensis]TWP54323.1 ABC transporter permease [Lentzea tibetensis]